MVLQIGDLLTDLGWSDGFHIPVANEENKRLESEVEEKMKRKMKLMLENEALCDRVDAMKKHVENLNHQYQENQGLLTAHKNQIQSIDDNYRVRVGEKMRIDREIRDMKKSNKELDEQNKHLMNEIQRHTESIEELKKTAKYDKEALLAWEEEMARGEEDNAVLIKYRAEDESKANAMEVKRQQLRVELVKSKDLLDRMINDVMDRELQLDKTAELFRASYKERQGLISQWDQTVTVLHQRDKDIENTIAETNSLREASRQKTEELAEHTAFYNTQMENNSQLERQISLQSRQLQQTREEHSALLAFVDSLTQELNVLKRLNIDRGNYLEGLRSRARQLAEEMATWLQRKEDTVKIVSDLRLEQEAVKNKTMTTNERTKQLGKLVDIEEKRLAVIDTDIKRLGAAFFRSTTQMMELKNKGRELMADISSAEVIKKQLALQAKEVENELNQQREVIYGLDFKTNCLQSRIDHLQGSADKGESQEVKEAKISELEQVLAEKMVTHNLLTTQLTRLEEDMRRLSLSLAEDQTELAKLQSARQGQVLMVEGGEKQLKDSRLRNQHRQVEENMLRLRVRQAEKALKNTGTRVYSLEKQRLELEAAMRERQVEIAAHKDVLNVKKRALNEEKAKLNSEIVERTTKIALMQKRHDLTLDMLGKDDEGQPLTVTQFKIRAMQERHMLQEEGDELDAKIRRAEKEIQALENTLVVINATNDTYRKSLSIVETDDPEFQQKLALEAEFHAARDHLKAKKSKMAEMHRNMQRIAETAEELDRREEEIRSEWREKQTAVADVDKDIREQQNKLERADKQLRRLRKEVRANGNPAEPIYEEKDAETRELLEQNMSALQQLSELVTTHAATGPVVTRYLQEKNLSLPIVHSPTGSAKYRLSIPNVQTTYSRQSLTSARSSVSSIVTIEPFKADSEMPEMISGTSASVRQRPSVSKPPVRQPSKPKRTSFDST